MSVGGAKIRTAALKCVFFYVYMHFTNCKVKYLNNWHGQPPCMSVALT